MIETTLALIVFLFPLAYSPGPGNMFFAANGARFGFASTLPSNIGYHVATFAVTSVIGFGFLTALASFPAMFLALKLAGSLYVLWIAWNLYRSGVSEESGDAKPATYIDGVVLLALNPKAYVIIALMFTQFLGKADGGNISAVLLITTVFTLNNLLAFSLWALIGDAIAAQFRTPQSAKRLNMIFGAMLASVACWMLLS